MATSPTQRTLRELKKLGIPAAVTEKWNPHVKFMVKNKQGEQREVPGIRQDLFGIVDVLALDNERGFVGIQACAGSGYKSHENKLLIDNLQATINWLETPGGVLEIWAWRKVKLKRGGKAERWQPRIREITIADII